MNKKLKMGLLFGIPALVGIYILFKNKKGKETYNDAKKEVLKQDNVDSFLIFTVTTLVTSLNIRQSHSITSQIIGKIPKGSLILARPSKTSGWMEYSEDGTNVLGYVSADYLSNPTQNK